jgi:hypothetical protein
MSHLLNDLYKQINEIFTAKPGNMEEIQDLLKSLNLKAMLVHGEILTLS